MEISTSTNFACWSMGLRTRQRKSSSRSQTQPKKGKYRQIIVGSIDDPWTKLAAGYYLIGDQAALDKLHEQHPTTDAGIGEMYAMDENWQLINCLNENPNNKGRHDLLIAEILFREAEAKIIGQVEPEPK